jgi:hypothetical protein
VTWLPCCHRARPMSSLGTAPATAARHTPNCHTTRLPCCRRHGSPVAGCGLFHELLCVLPFPLSVKKEREKRKKKRKKWHSLWFLPLVGVLKSHVVQCSSMAPIIVIGFLICGGICMVSDFGSFSVASCLVQSCPLLWSSQ